MTTCLLIGDTHIPNRAHWIPNELLAQIQRESIDLVLCIGDLTDESILRFFRELGELHVVRGNMDHLQLPKTDMIEIRGIRIGLIHGHGIYPRGDVKQLLEIARNMNVNILISGHTHQQLIHTQTTPEKITLLNPGSATGAWGGGGQGPPSMMLMKIEDECVLRSFKLIRGQLVMEEQVLDVRG